jgi:hypothetical protein
MTKRSSKKPESGSQMSDSDTADLSIFGTADVDSIPDDPYFTGEGTYQGFIGNVSLVANTDKRNIVITGVVDEPESEYHGNQCQVWLSIYDDPDLSDPRIKKSLSFLKRQLGWLGVSETEMRYPVGDLVELLKDKVKEPIVFKVNEYNSKKPGEQGKKKSSVQGMWLADIYEEFNNNGN